MININYEFRMPGTGTIAWYMKFETISGETKEKLQENLRARMDQLKPLDAQAVGLHNRRSDWEAAFGPIDESKGYHFGDRSPEPAPAPKSWLRRMFSKS